MRKLELCLTALAVVILGTPPASHAALQVQDFLVPGDGLVTYDTETQLRWLDVTYTTNQSYDDIMVRLATPTDDLFGFRYATASTLFELFSHAGIPDVPFPPGGAFTPSNAVPVRQFLSIVGFTMGSSEYPQTYGYYDDTEFGTSPTRIGMTILSVAIIGNGGVSFNPDSANAAYQSPSNGSWLVGQRQFRS